MDMMGLVITLAVLALVLLGVMLLGRLIGAQERKSREAEAAARAEKAVLVGQENRGELLAAIASVLAEEMGTSVSAIRILEMKRIA